MCPLSASPRKVEGIEHSLTEQVRLWRFEVSKHGAKSGAGYSHSQMEGVERSTTEG